MPLPGTIASGCPEVLIGGAAAARKSDLIDHGGLLVDGCASVTVGAAGLAAARVTDRYACPGVDPHPHVGGVVLPAGCPSVLIGTLPAARQGDFTLCLGPDSTVTAADAAGGAATDAEKSDCAKLWKGYEAEAAALIAPAGDDHRARNRIINGAYADLYLRDKSLAWVGLAAYASKQVGCAMDHAQRVSRAAAPPKTPYGGPITAPGIGAVSDYTYEKLGDGNKRLFLDIYPTHRFYEEQGYARLAECAGERVPPLTAPVLDAFKASDAYRKTGDKKYLQRHVAGIALHEQIAVLQRDVYNDGRMQKILRMNETGLPLTSPATAVLGPGCEARAGDPEFRFGDKGRTKLYSVPERMDWILHDIGPGYLGGVAGTPKMDDDLGDLRRQGSAAGGRYP
jgi:uncharacterized Zn-binding protein involved in type VI secretion